VRSDELLSLGERAADRARDGLGSFTFAAGAAVLIGVTIVLAVRHDDRAGPVAVLGLALSGLTLVELSLLLMAARRADRTAAESALYELESDRRAAAGVGELRDEVERLRGDLARLAARMETSSQRIGETRAETDS